MSKLVNLYIVSRVPNFGDSSLFEPIGRFLVQLKTNQQMQKITSSKNTFAHSKRAWSTRRSLARLCEQPHDYGKHNLKTLNYSEAQINKLMLLEAKCWKYHKNEIVNNGKGQWSTEKLASTKHYKWLNSKTATLYLLRPHIKCESDWNIIIYQHINTLSPFNLSCLPLAHPLRKH